MEFHLINHPLDCPVCDQAGECWLQIYYMKHGLYDPRMIDEKVHKPKAVPLGPHVMLDAERCILCSRCVRFCDEITGTGELGIFNRGDHSEIGLFPGHDAREQVLGQRRRHLPGRRAHRPRLPLPGARLVPRHRRSRSAPAARAAATSRCTRTAGGRTTTRAGASRGSSRASTPTSTSWWICDEGRYGFGWIDDAEPARPRRLARGRDARRARLGRGGRRRSARRSGATGPRRSASSPRPRCRTRTCSRCSALARARSASAHVDLRRAAARCRATRTTSCIRADKNPNTRGAELIGLGRRTRRGACLDGGRGGAAQAPVDLPPRPARLGLAGGRRDRGARARRDGGLPGHRTPTRRARRAHLVLPSAAYVEREGTFTNFEGRVQRFRHRGGAARRGAAGLGHPRPASRRALGGTDPALAAARGRAGLRRRCAGRRRPPFAGMSYRGARAPRRRPVVRGVSASWRPRHRRSARGRPSSCSCVLNLGGLLTWVERKQSAIMQDRIGANRASIFGFRAHRGCSTRSPTRSRC